MNLEVKIGHRRIGRGHPPYIIAELSANHNGEIEQALRLIDAAADAGADAVKLQTYTADTLTIDCDSSDFRITDGLWNGRTLYDLYREAHTPWEWHETLFAHARTRGITIFSSPFDATATDLLEELGAPAYKIASFEAVDLPLVRHVASKGKPMIISTGMANLKEIEEAVMAALQEGCKELVLLHCVSGYPAPPDDYKLATLTDMERRFGVPVGLSDHTLSNVTAIASVALGAAIIEKHFTLNRSGGGPDDSFSLEPQDLRQLCRDANIAWQSIGSVDYGLKSSERPNAVFRRSLYAVQDILKGELFTPKNIRSIRPGYGLPPKYYGEIIGRPAKRDIKRGDRLDWSCIKTRRNDGE